jgi:hypothetical protein
MAKEEVVKEGDAEVWEDEEEEAEVWEDEEEEAEVWEDEEEEAEVWEDEEEEGGPKSKALEMRSSKVVSEEPLNLFPELNGENFGWRLEESWLTFKNFCCRQAKSRI